MPKVSYEPLIIPKSYRDTRQGYAVRCNKCNRNVTVQCGLSKKKIHTCKAPESHRFVSKVYDPIKGVMVHKKSWPKELRNNKEYYRLHAELVENHESPKIKSIDGKPLLLNSCLALYADYIADVDVPSHKRRSNTHRHIQSQVTHLRHLKEALQANGINPEYFPITDFDDVHVGMIHDYLLERYSNKTYNHKIAAYRAFFKFLISNDYEVKNHFLDVLPRRTKAKTDVISHTEFNELLKSTTPIQGTVIERQIRNGKERMFKRKLYKDYLIDVWKFALYSGCRKTEIQEVRVKDVRQDHIICLNQKSSKKKKEEVFRLVWLNEELLSLVSSLKKGLSQDDFLLAPEEKNRENMMHIVSRAFSHYWSKISDRDLRFHDLRNIYVLEMIKRYGTEMADVLGGLHSDSAVTIRHYLNKEEVLKHNKRKKLFG